MVLHGANTFWSRRGWRSRHTGQRRRARTWCVGDAAGHYQLQHTGAVCNQAHLVDICTGRLQLPILQWHNSGVLEIKLLCCPQGPPTQATRSCSMWCCGATCGLTLDGHWAAWWRRPATQPPQPCGSAARSPLHRATAQQKASTICTRCSQRFSVLQRNTCSNCLAAVLWLTVCVYLCLQLAFFGTCACALSFRDFFRQPRCLARTSAGGA